MAHLKERAWIVTEDGIEHEIEEAIDDNTDEGYRILRFKVIIGETRFDNAKMVPLLNSFYYEAATHVNRDDSLDELAIAVNRWEQSQ